MLTGPKKENALISFAPGNLGHQRESKVGPAGGGGRGTDDDCTADGCILGCGGFCCGMEAACWDGEEGGDDTFCLMSSSTACSVAMFWAICSCLAASCSTLRRTTSRLDAKGSSCCTGSGAVAATAGDSVVVTDNNQPSDGAWATTMSLAASPWDCQARVAPMPMRTSIKNRVRVRNIRLPIDGRSLAI